MVWLGWIILGGIVGWVASIVVKQPGCMPRYTGMGVLGALIGGLIFSPMQNSMNVPGLTMYSFIVSLLGALVFIWVTRMVKDRS